MLAAQIAACAVQSPCFHISRRRQAEALHKCVVQCPLACSCDTTKIADGERLFGAIVDRRQRSLQYPAALGFSAVFNEAASKPYTERAATWALSKQEDLLRVLLSCIRDPASKTKLFSLRAVRLSESEIAHTVQRLTAPRTVEFARLRRQRVPCRVA